MCQKSISLISGSKHTKMALHNQLKEYLDDIVCIKSYAIDEGIEDVIKDDLIVISSQIAMEELIALEKIDLKNEIIIANRTISHGHVDDLVLLPKGTKVLFVNDVKGTCFEGIEALKKIGFDYLEYIPYYPGINSIPKNINIAITPGEYDKVPKSIEKIYDIGPRIMDFTTITKILNKLDVLDEKAGQFSQKFLKKIINIGKRLAKSSNQILNLNQHLNQVLDGLNDGLLVYDMFGEITVFNENLKKMLNRDYKNIVGKNIKNIIYNKKLLSFLMDKDSKEGQIINIDGMELLLNKFQLSKGDSSIVIFKNVKETMENSDRLKRELIKKGFYAKYTFDDIIGVSENIKRLKQIAKKLSKADITILIEGESGTGKELIASSIHNVSNRKDGPFLAVNFSALSDELIESELFGYEEGAFTGAKKGGKVGLFEQADGGTIFLDEIGDISTKVQARLLRVLQEKEIMRVGGNNIKSVDVRIIAATNKNLAKLVNENKFREDLYYRLKLGYIKVPPLRERKEDIIALMKYFISTETRADIKISKEVIKELLNYDWYGNVRELKNILSYMLAVRDEDTIKSKDIPDRGFFQTKGIEDIKCQKNELDLDEEESFILKKIYELNKSGEIVGREKLANETKSTKFEMTKYQMRSRLNKLSTKGLILKKKGKHGTVLSEKGKNLLMVIMG
ncbi:MAG: AAA family ATPase [Firmicutes bacterium]|nr:AAA family ATPase [Bacillota bacterium]